MNKKLALCVVACILSVSTACIGPSCMEVDCVDGELICLSNDVYVCADRNWDIQTACENNSVCNERTFVCDAPEFVFICKDGDKRCDDYLVEVCADNAWNIETQCAMGQICHSDDYSCHPPCDEGATICTEDGKLERCVNKGWITTNCVTGQVCPSGKISCEPIVCEEGSRVCNDTQDSSLACIDNVIVETACTGDTALCQAGVCIACLNGDNRCENNARETCVNHLWTIQEACGSKVCDADTDTCLVIECEAGWQRCNANAVEICGAKGQYEPIAPAACAADSHCLENADAHTVACVECKGNADCASLEGTNVCHSNNTCVACTPFDKKCHESDGTFILCDENGAWETSGTTCAKGHECLADANACTPKDSYCTDTSDCKDTLYAWCSDETSLCECEIGHNICKVEDGQAKLSVCMSSSWSEYSNCDSKTPFCNNTQTACAECTDDIHCGEYYRCNMTSNTCEAALPASTIKWCSIESVDAEYRFSFGRVIDNRDPTDPTPIPGKAICGKEDQAIRDYQTFNGQYNGKPYEEDYCNYATDLSDLTAGEYICLWSFQIEGQMPVACQKNGTVITDINRLAPPDAGIKYTVKEILWDHIVDFEDCPTTATQTNDSCTSGLSYTNGITPSAGETITGRSLKLNAGGTATITAPNGVDILSIDVKKVNSNEAKVELTIDTDDIVIRNGMPPDSLETWLTPAMGISGSVDIVIKTSERIVIDNLKWTNHP